MSGDATGYIQNVQCVNGKLRFTSNGQWYEITTDASRSGLSVTYLCVISETDHPTVEYFQSLIDPYTLILITGYYSTKIVGTILYKEKIKLTGAYNQIIVGDNNPYIQINYPSGYMSAAGYCTFYVYGVN